MKCAWNAYINLLPLWMRDDVDRLGRESLQELRLRIHCFPELVLQNSSTYLKRVITENDIQFIMNAASRYSPWSAYTLQNGYITTAGGHRIGVCGEVVLKEHKMTGIRSANMLCLRVARQFQNIANGIETENRSILIIGQPGSGKTTLLRDLIRCYSESNISSIGVVDERGELFPVSEGRQCFSPGNHTDVLTGVDKEHGIEILLRCMNPRVIAVDEITSFNDCKALIEAGWCGVHLFATAHAGSREDLFKRPVYKPLLETGLFNTLVIMQADKSWRTERMLVKCIV